MSIIQAAGAGEAATAFYPFEISNSLRFNDDDSPFLSFTPSSAGTEEKFTFSCWVKRGNLSSGEMYFFSAGHSDFNNFGGLEFLGNEIAFQNYNSGTQVISRTGNTLFRDTAAWYNIVWQFDSTDNDPTDGTDRARLYVNGTQITAFTGNVSNLTHNYISQFNTAVQHTIGCRQAASQDAFFDGYLADVNFIDGGSASSDASDFGELKENIWIPKDTSGLYASAGANSFRLQFKNSSTGSASSSTVGADTSGKNNHFSSTNIASTDVMTDSPTDNHATMDVNANTFFNGTFSDGNLQISPSSVTFATSTIGMTSGKYYAEVEFEANSAAQMLCGITRVAPVANGDNLGSKDGQIGYYNISGNKLVNGGTGSGGNAYGATYTVGDIIGIAVNMDDGEIEFRKNNESQGTITGAIDTTKTYFFASGDFSSANNNTMIWNYGANAFAYTPPSGFEKLSTANLPNPAIDPAAGETPDEYWDAQPYTGDGGTKEISSFAFAPNWVWIKNRDNADDHYMYDSIRGATKTLHPNKTDAEFTSSNALQSFDSDGFTTGSDGGTNRGASPAQRYIAWAWKAGTSFSNDASVTNVGTIDSTGSVSTEAGFSIISYTGTGSSGTIAHGLGATPSWFFVKNRDDGDAAGFTNGNWIVYHQSLSTNQFMKLETNDAVFTNSDAFGGAPSSTTIQLGTFNSTNGSGDSMICYAFAEKEGYSKFGSYDDSVVGSDYENTSPFVYTGFRVGWLMIKGTSAGRDWVIYDNKRTPDNGVYLRANEAGTEQTDATNHDISFLSNGFKIRGGSGDINTTSESYIYMAFADQPFKFANGGTE
jgi:hypothetical protein